MNTQKGDKLAARIEEIKVRMQEAGSRLYAGYIEDAIREYRKPWTLADHMRRFFPSWDEATMPLHRKDWAQDMLPEGWRPIIKGEPILNLDEYAMNERDRFDPQYTQTKETAEQRKTEGFWRTARPLPVVVDPCEALKKAHAEGKVIQYRPQGDADWFDLTLPTWTEPLSEYRVKPDPVMVPLSAEDVAIGSAIRFDGWMLHHWVMVAGTAESYVEYLGKVSMETVDFAKLQKEWTINRNDGKGFVRCEKPEGGK